MKQIYSSNPRLAGYDLRNNKARNLTMEQVRYNIIVRLVLSFAVLLFWCFAFVMLMVLAGFLSPEHMQ